MPVLIVDLVLQVLELAERVLQAAVELLDPLILLRDLVLKCEPLVALLLDPELEDIELPLDLILEVPLLPESLALKVIQSVFPLLLGIIQQVEEVGVALLGVLIQEVYAGVHILSREALPRGLVFSLRKVLAAGEG
jgi:hypothetical protein